MKSAHSPKEGPARPLRQDPCKDLGEAIGDDDVLCQTRMDGIPSRLLRLSDLCLGSRPERNRDGVEERLTFQDRRLLRSCIACRNQSFRRFSGKDQHDVLDAFR